jgi:hypothetical protein|tara:strand:+ start:360 stop:476 length:117 start_codon:yes stop_codon:yes gene_type:complete
MGCWAVIDETHCQFVIGLLGYALKTILKNMLKAHPNEK